MKNNPHFEPRTVALVLGVSIGFGIAVHEVFFLVALGVAAIAAVDALQEHWETTHAHS